MQALSEWQLPSLSIEKSNINLGAKQKEKTMPIKMKALPLSERPYEKLETYGEGALSNSELLAIIIKTGTKEETAVTLAQKILQQDNRNRIKRIARNTVKRANENPWDW